MNKGALFLLPTHLGSDNWEEVIPSKVRDRAINIRYFAVENIRTARRYLRKLDRSFPIDDAVFFLLNKRTESSELSQMLAPVYEGRDIAIISEAGCPGVADPGAKLVALAQQKGVFVHPMVGPSSILLALMASGFNGQSFCFNGYIPKDRKARKTTIKKFEYIANTTGQTQLFMETPFRNENLMEDILQECMNETLLCVARDVSLPSQKILTKPIGEWKKTTLNLHKHPAMFLIGKTGNN